MQYKTRTTRKAWELFRTLADDYHIEGVKIAPTRKIVSIPFNKILDLGRSIPLHVRLDFPPKLFKDISEALSCALSERLHL